ncbi:MAG: ATPase, T2SS/T4P/T4SS family, partial [Bdellovibrionales bacterium]
EDDSRLTRTSLSDLAQIIASYNGIDWKSDSDTLSAKLPDGTRVEVFQTKSVVSGFSMSLRKRKANSFTMQNFGISPEQEEDLIAAIKARKNILLSGGTSTGKTSLLEILAAYIPDEIRLITIQDPIEITFRQPNRLDLTLTSADPNKRTKELADICMTAMRQNPDSIIFGEIREKTMAYTYRTASNTGHDGCMATIHANDPDAALERVTNLVHAAEGGHKDTIMQEIKNCIDIVIQLRKTMDGKRTAIIKTII